MREIMKKRASRINFVMQFIVINYKYNLLLILWKKKQISIHIYINILLYNYTNKLYKSAFTCKCRQTEEIKSKTKAKEIGLKSNQKVELNWR